MGGNLNRDFSAISLVLRTETANEYRYMNLTALYLEKLSQPNIFPSGLHENKPSNFSFFCVEAYFA